MNGAKHSSSLSSQGAAAGDMGDPSSVKPLNNNGTNNESATTTTTKTKKKSRKNRLSKSERRRRKRAREQEDAQQKQHPNATESIAEQQNNIDNDDKGKGKKLKFHDTKKGFFASSSVQKHHIPQQKSTLPNHHQETGQKSNHLKNSSLLSSSLSVSNSKSKSTIEKNGHEDKNSNDSGNDNGNKNSNGTQQEKNDLAKSTTSSNDYSNLVEFLYPKKSRMTHKRQQKQQYQYDGGYDDEEEAEGKPYIHAKIRSQQNYNDNSTESTFTATTTLENTKEKAKSLGVMNESIDDILFSKKKKMKMNETKEENVSTATNKNEDEDKNENMSDHDDHDSDSSKSSDDHDHDDHDKSEKSSIKDHHGDTDMQLKKIESYDADPASIETESVSCESKKEYIPFSSLQQQQQQNHKPIAQTVTTKQKESGNDIDKNKNNNRAAVQSSTLLIESNSVVVSKRKRSISEDSSSHRDAKSQLSGISVEMALKDKFGRRPRLNSTDGELNLPRRGLCDEQKVMAFHKWDLDKYRPSPPRGFHNLGNTCFLNATLQCLAHLPTFCQCIASIDPTALQLQQIRNNGKKRKRSNGQLITMALRTLLHNVHGLNQNGNGPKQSPIAPKAIANSISLIDGSNRGYKFRPGRQEDAHEFLVHLLNAMNDGELKGAGINQNKSGWRDKLPIPRLDETTFVHRMFGGYLRSQVCCTSCDYKSNTYDPFLDLSLEVSTKKVNSVYSALKEYTRRETLDAANKWKCSGCKKRVCATKQLTCFRPPLSLCIQLKRFSFDGDMGGFMHHQFGYSHFAGKGMGMRQGGSKIQKAIQFPAELKLPLSDGRKCEYHLTGVVVHVGSSATSGHYTAFVKRQMKQGSQWYRMDDSYVEPVSEVEVLQERDAYVLFYCRKEVKLNLPNPPSISVQEVSQIESVTEHMNTVNNSTEKTETEKIEKKEATLNSSKKHRIEDNSRHSDSKEASILPNTASSDSNLLNGKKKRSKSKFLTLDHGSKHGSVQVMLKKFRRNNKAWKPPSTQGGTVETVLLGDTKITKWDNDGNDNENVNKFRDSVSNDLKQEQKKRKRNMYLDSWDSGLDTGKVKKVKDKSSDDYILQTGPNNQFQRLQHSLTQLKRRGKTTSMKKRRR